MNAHPQSSGPRSNAYSESKFINWTAYALFGAQGKLGVNYAHHGHIFTKEDWKALMDFADKNLRGMKVSRKFDQFLTEAELDAAAAAGSKSHPSK